MFYYKDQPTVTECSTSFTALNVTVADYDVNVIRCHRQSSHNLEYHVVCLRRLSSLVITSHRHSPNYAS